MILVDTNVISEPLRKAPHTGVIEWIDSQPLETLYLSAITVAELRFGVAALPAGKRRNTLHDNLETMVLPMFTGRVLAFDLAATQAYAHLMSARAQPDWPSVRATATSRPLQLPTAWQSTTQ